MTIDGDETAGFITAEGNDLARLIASGLTYAKAGEQVGLSETSVYRRMKDPDFRALVDSWRRQHVDGVLAALVPEGLRSVSYLASVRDDPDVAVYLRVRAAQELLASLSRIGRQITLTEITPDAAHELLKAELRRFIADRETDDDD